MPIPRHQHRQGTHALLLSGLLLAAAVALAGASPIDNVDVEPAEVSDGVQGTAITESFENFASWEAAVGGVLSFNRFADLQPGVIVNDQYMGTGAVYRDQDDFTLPYDFSSDGMILQGEGRVHIVFAKDIGAIGIRFPGALRIVAYRGPHLVFTSADYGFAGAGFFGGVISDEPFDTVELLDWLDDRVFPDDIYFVIDTATGTEATTWGRIKALF